MRELWGACKKGIEHNLCFGCNKLELNSFTGQEECEYLVDPLEEIKKMLGIQEKIEL